MSERDLPLSEIAKLAGVRVSAASNWRTRHADFPAPKVVAGQELFDSTEMSRWLSQRKIPRNGLRPDEPHGTTYGDRFAKKSGANTAEAVAAAHRESAIGKLWNLADLLRGELDSASAVQFTMALLYLRKTAPEQWSELLAASAWELQHRLDKALSRGPDAHLFPGNRAPLSDRTLIAAVRLVDELPAGTDFGGLFDDLFQRADRDLGRHGGHFTPPSVVRVLVEILATSDGESVYDPSCGSGELLVALGRTGTAGNPLFGQALNDQSYRFTAMNLAMHDQIADIRVGGPQIEDGSFSDKQFDVVLANPPFSGVLPDSAEFDNWPFGPPSKRGMGFAWLQIAAAKLKPGGRAAMLMPAGSLSHGGRDGDVRRRMVENGLVVGVIALPSGLFTSTGIPVSLWLLRKPLPEEPPRHSMLFVNASRLGTQARTQRHLLEEDLEQILRACRGWQHGDDPVQVEAGFSRFVELEEVRNRDYQLHPGRYVDQSAASWENEAADAHWARADSLRRHLGSLHEEIEGARRALNSRLDQLADLAPRNWRTERLGDLCEIQVGLGQAERDRGVHTPGWTPLLLPRNIKLGFLSHDELDTLDPEVVRNAGTNWAKYQLRAGDVVSARSGTLGRHGLVSARESGWILGPSCMRIRPKGDVQPAYLVHYLNSPEMHSWITQSSTSTAIPHISSKRMEQLPLALPPLEVQSEIAAAMDALADQMRRYDEAVSATGSLRDQVFSTLMSGRK
ncbi:N-6 DNA methylase [Lentzea sp. NPDC058450]|uniref:N-6 DNA methylase n=1 Tax=Lentzea sp. NPDC058450 TaxID=3346505 RepID=UPI0036684192